MDGVTFFDIINNCSDIVIIVFMVLFFIKPIRDKLIAKIDIPKSNDDALLLKLAGFEIRSIYTHYKNDKALPQIIMENISSVYDDYKNRGGNGYIKSIYQEMKTWDTY